ncbi:MAG: TlpA family protein disulfide reductase [Hyphomonadaceae bacterium]|nr:TlpA family protein disulfide reductase [Hyphomonadaceae bacterium]
MLASAGAVIAVPEVAWATSYIVPALPPDLDGLRGLALTTADGALTTLADLAPAGRATVISFWATWCAPCLLETRHLAQVRRRYPASRLTIIGINVDRTPDEGRIGDFLSRAGTNFPQLRAGRDAYRAFGGPAAIELPRTFVFAPDGRPLAAFGVFDAVSEAEVDRAVARAVG